MSEAHRIDQLNDGLVLYIAIDPDGIWARSEFPHPLITVDYDADGRIIGISPAGPQIDNTLDAYQRWLKDGDGDPRRLVSNLEDSEALTPA
jgi:hypothetical protein